MVSWQGLERSGFSGADLKEPWLSGMWHTLIVAWSKLSATISGSDKTLLLKNMCCSGRMEYLALISISTWDSRLQYLGKVGSCSSLAKSPKRDEIILPLDSRHPSHRSDGNAADL
jgi:hypothetical protein